MATAKKLPSGSWRCLVYSHTEVVNGEKKRRYQSFTADTKREAECQASIWIAGRSRRPDDISVLSAVEKYIASKEHVLSPSTIRGYKANVHNFDLIGATRLRSLKTSDVQIWVSSLSETLSPKTVSNVYGLFTATLSMFAPDMTFRITLPAKQRHETKLLSDKELQVLLGHVKGKELWIAIMLARYYSLRRSEICGLYREDLKGNTLTIRRAMIHNKDKDWVIKETPKTFSSYRYLIIDEPLLSVLKKCKGKIISCNPDALCDRYYRAIKASGVPRVSFHSLRHMFASSAAMANVPDIVTARMGGWNPNSSTLKRVYQDVRDEDLRKQMEKLNKMMQQEIQHEKEKPQ